MTARELAELVQQMRDEQRAYFKTRATDHLEESKRLEKQVDVAVRSILQRQGTLDLG